MIDAIDIDSIDIVAPAKINLFLSILGRRNDGYHDLQTLFQLLDYGDNIRLRRTTDGVISITPAIEGIAPEQNLAFRAAQLLQQHSQSQFGAAIHIDKKLPMGGGLGGGSSNAASTLLGLNALWGTQLSLTELASLGLQLGADVPVFVWGQNSLAEGVGERLYPVDLVENYYLVLKPAVEVSTAKIFGDPALTRNSPAIRIAAFFEQAYTASDAEASTLQAEALTLQAEALATEVVSPLASKSGQQALIDQWLLTLGNDCEAVVRNGYPDVDKAFVWLNQYAKAKLTGTGSCIFAKFDNREEAESVLAKSALEGFVAKASNKSLAHQQLEQIADST